MDEASEAETIFTLEDRDDGWDDVRNTIKTARKERIGAWEEIQRDYVKPTAAWTKVITSEIKEIVVDKRPMLDVDGVVTPTKQSAAPSPPPLFASRPSPPPPPAAPRQATAKAPKASFADQLMGSVASALDKAPKKQQQQAKATPPPKASKAVDIKSGTIATANIALLAGIPVATLIGIILIATA